MSTICSDGCTAAADTQASMNNMLMDVQTIKLKLVEGRLFGLVGAAQYIDHAIAWVMDPETSKKPAAKEDDTWTLVEFTAPHCRVWSGLSEYEDTHHYPVAFGTGAQLALGAMSVGASPEEAVEAAKKRDLFTGGDTIVHTIPGV